MTDYQYLRCERVPVPEGARGDVVLVVRMTNPPRNFLNAAMVSELSALADETGRDESVRAVVLTGGVDGVFIEHYDVRELVGLADAMRSRAPTPDGVPAGAVELHGMHKMLLALQALPQPVIAAINGTAMGGGCELALGCDIRLMAAGYRIGLPEVRVGILPGAGGTQRLSRLIGAARALELMMLGNTVPADVAERIGLVHRVVGADELLDETLLLAGELARRPRRSIALIKQCVLQGTEMPLVDALALEQESFFETMRTDDASRLMRRYLESDLPLDEQ